MNAYKFNKEYEKKNMLKCVKVKTIIFQGSIQNRREECIFDRVWISDLNKSLVNIEVILFS